MAGEWLREPRARAGERERELVVGVLRDASTRGQLSASELEQRWQQLRSAHTVGDLVPLVSDLPNVPEVAERPSGRRRAAEPPPEHVRAARAAFPDGRDDGARRRPADAGDHPTYPPVDHGMDEGVMPAQSEHTHPAFAESAAYAHDARDRAQTERSWAEQSAWETANDRGAGRRGLARRLRGEQNQDAGEQNQDGSEQDDRSRSERLREEWRGVTAAVRRPTQPSAAEEWNASLRAFTGSLALLAVALLLTALLS